MGQIWQGERSWPVDLKALQVSGTVILPGGFANRAYALTLPAGVSGLLVLEVSQGLPSPLRTVISVAPAGEGTAAPAPLSAKVLNPTGAGHTAASTIQRSFLNHFSALDPVYFIYGPKAPAAKFQFSLKYRMLSFDGDTTEIAKSTLQFGYTQRSLWNVSANPSAFYDTSYMPSLFYQFRTLAPVYGCGPGRPEMAWIPVGVPARVQRAGLHSGAQPQHLVRALGLPARPNGPVARDRTGPRIRLHSGTVKQSRICRTIAATGIGR